MLLGGAVLLGCEALFAGPDVALPITGLDVEPKPGQLEPMMPGARGPLVEIASGEVGGEDFRLTLYRSVDGFCLALSAPQYRGGGCGPAPGDGLPEFDRFGMIAQSGLANGTIEIDGVVDADVAKVWVVTVDGQRANAVLIPAQLDDLDASVFLVFLPEGMHPQAIVAADGSGDILDEFPLLSIAPGGPGAPPTPGD